MSLTASTGGAEWDALRAALAELSALSAQEQVSLLALGKAYARLSVAMRDVAAASDQTSLRFEAAACALELRTKKSALEAFVAAAGEGAASRRGT